MQELLSTPVKITSTNLEIIELKFNEAVHLPFGTIKTRPSAWLRLEGVVNGEEAVGAAEGTALPMQIPLYDDFSNNLQENINSLCETLTDDSTLTVEQHINAIAGMQLGGNFATARMTVEASLLDMTARSRNKSIANIIAGDTQSTYNIPYGKSIAENEYKKIITATQEAAQKGAQRLKYKLSPANFNVLYPALVHITKAYPNINCMVDANGMFDPTNSEHIEMLRTIDSIGLLTIEEPVSRAGKLTGLIAHRALKEALTLQTPITMDDAIKTASDAKFALDNRLAQIINLKPGRVGSFVECVRIADYAKQRGGEVMVGGMFEATPGRMMTLTLAAYCLRQGFKIPGDVSLPQERLSEDLVPAKLTLDKNCDVIFQPKLGWGYDL